MIISLTGFMGCGKSSTGRELALRLGAAFIDLDGEIVARSGRSIPEIFREGGEAAFRAAELEALQAVLDAADAAQGDTVHADRPHCAGKGACPDALRLAAHPPRDHPAAAWRHRRFPAPVRRRRSALCRPRPHLRAGPLRRRHRRQIPRRSGGGNPRYPSLAPCSCNFSRNCPGVRTVIQVLP